MSTWNLKAIPQTVHFYWGNNKKVSFLQFMSVYTFWQLNPEWCIKIHCSTKPNQLISWKTGEQNYKDNYDDFTTKLGEIPTIHYVYHDFDAYGLPNTLTEVHKSDLIRLKVLSSEGGLYSDIDILFIKPMNLLQCNKEEFANKDTFVSICHYGHSIGFLMSSPGNEYYKDLYNTAIDLIHSGVTGYQQIGAPMINSKYRDINNIPGNVYNFPMSTVYPYDAQHIKDMFLSNNLCNIKDDTIGVHWYAGANYAGDFLNSTNGGLLRKECVISSLLGKFYSDNKYPIADKSPTNNKVFLFGGSGAGKTTFARQFANRYNVEYFDFDLYFGLVFNGWNKNSSNASNYFLSLLPNKFITEFVPSCIHLQLEKRYDTFIEYTKRNNVQIIAILCSNREEWFKRLASKSIKKDNDFFSSLAKNRLDVLNLFESKGIAIDYYDTYTNRYVSKEEYLRINEEVKNYD
jgi:hypothetical protein